VKEEPEWVDISKEAQTYVSKSGDWNSEGHEGKMLKPFKVTMKFKKDIP